ncbi:MAG: bifunctional oligoribonuclease/PAP phosphatase NrnA [Actinobacteria bacterium]|nr:bifunctional oligoribonuclease/PAP phosphatase NrnA [Actinomycetota bacterium]
MRPERGINEIPPTAAARRQVVEHLERARRPLILSHRDPDPDSIGSALGLAKALDAMGATPIVALHRLAAVTAPLNELPGFARILPLTEAVGPATRGEPRSFDLLVAVDTADPILFGLEAAQTERLLTGGPVVCIDHHVSNRRYATCNYVDPSASATAEMIWEILVSAGSPIVPEIAVNLQAGLVGDTLGFQTRATTGRTLRAAADLLERGGHPGDMPRRALNARSFESMRLFGSALAATERSEDGRIIWTSVTRALAAAAGATLDASQGIPSGLQDIIGAEVSVVFYETAPARTRVSLRSVHRPINAVAEAFGGGGHELAAGCKVEEPLARARELVLEHLRNEFRR